MNPHTAHSLQTKYSIDRFYLKAEYMDKEDLEGKSGYGSEGYGSHSGQLARHLQLKKKLKFDKEVKGKDLLGVDHAAEYKRPDYQSRITIKGKGGKMNTKSTRDQASDETTSSSAGLANEFERKGIIGEGDTVTSSSELLKAQIIKKLSEDASMDASHIDVSIHDGAVLLSGHVSDIAEKRKVEQIAEGITGIHSVDNKIILKEEERRSKQVSSPASSHATDKRESK